MHVQGPDRQVGLVHHYQGVDLVVFHDFQGLGREHVGTGGLAVDSHHFFDQRLVNVDVAVEAAAQVAVGEDPGQPAIGLGDHGHAQAFARHFQQGVLEQGAALNLWQFVAGVHHVLDLEQQAAAQSAAGVREGEVFRGETAGFEQGNGQGVTQDQRRGGRGGRCQVERAGFLGNTGVEVDLGGLGEGRVGVAGQADELDAQALDQWQQGDDFGGGAGVGQCQDHVIPGDHAHVAMAGLGGVNEERRGAGAGQGGSDLVADVPGLAHTHHDNAALAFQDQFAGFDEIGIDVGQQALYRFDFVADGALCGLDQVGGLAHVENRSA